jgi:carboxylesterase type B
VFKSIPFAEPPVGALRWKAPKPRSPWAPNIYDATYYRDSCVQNCVLPDGLCGESYSEDCLYMNVYTPLNVNTSSALPVMVFIPGGDMDMGTANCDLYDASYVVGTRDVVIVTLNYRLGSFGFLVDPKRGITGNYGMQDQRLALQWVQENIVQFGGNPNDVTLFGESAGAFCVMGHIVSPLSAGLFHKSIVQSIPLMLPYRTISSASTLGEHFVDKAGCAKDKSDSCIRQLNSTQVLQAQVAAGKQCRLLEPIVVFMPWTPIIDGKEILEEPLVALRKGSFNKVPMMLGSLSEEAIMFVYLALDNPLNTLKYDGILTALFTTKVFAVHALYPAQHQDKRVDLSVLGTDLIFAAPTRNASMNIAKHNDVYLYQFDHVLSFDCWSPRYPFCNGHSCHGAELPFVFNSASTRGFKFTPEEQRLSEQMIDYWTNFAWTGNPNSGPRAVSLQWPKFNAQSLYNMKFATPTSVEQGLRKEYMDAWDRLGYKWP